MGTVLFVGRVREPRVIQRFLGRDPLAWIEVRHLADEILEVGIEEVALPESEGAPRVLLVKRVCYPSEVGRPGMSSTKILQEPIEIIPVREVGDLAGQNIDRRVDLAVASARKITLRRRRKMNCVMC